MTRPLDGTTILSLEHAVAAPFATRQLADLGARVIKVERPGSGDFARSYDSRVRGEASYFVWANRSKQSLTLDVKTQPGRQVLGRLLQISDVLVQNLAPGAAARLGLSGPDLRSRLPALILCDISGYGNSGPMRDKKAYDLLIQAEAGLLSVTGSQDEPARAGISVADISAGMYAFSSILAALIQRQRTGLGSHIEVSLFDSLLEWMGNPIYYAFEGQPPAARTGASHPSIYPYGPFATADGKIIMVGLQNEREWAAFCAHVLQQPQLTLDERFDTNAQRSVNRDALRGFIHEVFLSLTGDEVLARLDRAAIGNATVNDMSAVWEHPQLRARNRWSQVDSPGGPIPALKPPPVFDTFEAHMGPVPKVGEHSDAILSELGYTASEILGLREARIV